MDCISTRLSYSQTGYFSGIITDYLQQAATLSPFYKHPVSPEGIRASIRARQEFPTDRQGLVKVLREQYSRETKHALVGSNIELLLRDNTFTVCTAHQPAIFTGPLYFIYKILHTVRLAGSLKTQYPEYDFVPVFYMGSEDADLEELGNIFLGEEKLVWETSQKGAVGRMKTQGLDTLLDRVEGELSVMPFGVELLQTMRDCYLNSPDVQTATFRLLHHLFADYGLVVLIPDHPGLKKYMRPVFENDLFHNTSSGIVAQTLQELSKNYKAQAHPREINLFYLKDDLRGRIERRNDHFIVHGSELSFTEEEIRQELEQYPERFSPNVILRGLYQETILPNIAFIGGGGETAYWLELKALFGHYGVPYPVLILRNSFLLIEAAWKEKLCNAGIPIKDIFRPEEELVNEMVKSQSHQQLSLDKEIAEARDFYARVRKIASTVDPTLGQHIEALESKAMKPLEDLEKKLLKAEKRKFEDQRRQVHAIRAALFPLDSLQERIVNFMPWYAALGPAFIRQIYEYSLTLEQEFVVLTEQ